MFRYTKKELANLFIVTLVLTFVFAFNDGRPTFILGNWIENFIKVFFIVALGLLVHDFGHDLIARRNGFNSEFRNWGLRKFTLKGRNWYPKTFNIFGKKITLDVFPLGIILALLVTIFSNGKLYWAGVSSYALIVIKSHRLGRKFIEVTDFEEAKVAIAGPFAMLVLLFILKIFNTSGVFDQALLIYSVIAVYDMLPLPGLDGFKVLMGSKPLFAFGFVFILTAVLLTHYLSAIFALLLAVLISFVIGVLYVYLNIYK